MVLFFFISTLYYEPPIPLFSSNTTLTPPLAAFGLSLVAAFLALIAAWLGGELVDRLGVGVDDGPHLNSPSSVSHRPANHPDPKMRRDA